MTQSKNKKQPVSPPPAAETAVDWNDLYRLWRAGLDARLNNKQARQQAVKQYLRDHPEASGILTEAGAGPTIPDTWQPPDEPADEPA